MTIDRVVERVKAGALTAEGLNPIIRTLAENANSGAQLLERYTPVLEGLLNQLQIKLVEFFTPREPDEEGNLEADPDLADTLKLADKVSVIIERLTKMVMQSVKAKDDAARLQMALEEKGGASDLDDLGEGELRKKVLEAAAGFITSETP